MLWPVVLIICISVLRPSAVSRPFLDFLVVVVVFCLVLGMVGVGVCDIVDCVDCGWF